MIKCQWSSRGSAHDGERRLKKTSRPRGRRRTAETLLLCSLSCCHSLIKHTHTHARARAHTHTNYPTNTSQRSRVCWAAAEPSLHSLMQGEVRPDTWGKQPVLDRPGQPGADRGPHPTPENPQHGKQRAGGKCSSWCQGGDGVGWGGQHSTNLFSGRRGSIRPSGHTASGDGGRRRGRYDSSAMAV